MRSAKAELAEGSPYKTNVLCSAVKKLKGRLIFIFTGSKPHVL
jgi:hypothetical protein